MKKLLALLLALAMTACLFACGDTKDAPATTKPTETPTEAPTEAPTETPTEPADKVMTYAEFMAADADAECVIEFYAQDVQPWWFDTEKNQGKITVYGQTTEGGYFAYQAICDEETGKKVLPGVKVRITGSKTIFNGLHEIMYGTLEIVEATAWIAEPLDVTALVGTDALAEQVCKKIAIKNATVVAATDAGDAFKYNWDGSGSEGSDLYFYVQIGDAVQELVIESYLCGVGSDAYEAVRSLQVGDQISVEGYLYWYQAAQPHVYKVVK